MPEAVKIRAAKAAVVKKWKNGENSGMAADASQKQEIGDRCSKELWQKSSFCVINGFLSS